jgi:hypothetical protein
MSTADLFLPGVATEKALAALGRAGGNEIGSGKFANPESSAALAVNSFGWFLDRPGQLPPFPCLADLDWPAVRVDVERQMRFPWRGGRHPWLDAAIETGHHLIGVESKRYEPFRDKKLVRLSTAYDRDVWGGSMEPFTEMRDRMRAGDWQFDFLDAAQLVKHALGLLTEGERTGKAPILLYLYAEPALRGAVPIDAGVIAQHRQEIAEFATAIAGARVRFASCSYREWLATWPDGARAHGDAVLARFRP